MSVKRRALVILLLWIGFAQLLGAATALSATIDEGFHITSGYEYLRTGRLRLFDEHTPLAKALFAWPLFFVPDLAPPEQAAGYAEGNLITAAQATVLAYRPLDRVIVACRIPVALLTLLLAASVCRWASRLGGAGAGLLALALFIFDPNVLAQGSLATTDMGATAFIFWATVALADYLRHSPTRWGWWKAALLLGLALGAKLTALMLLPVNGVLMLLNSGAPAPTRSTPSAFARRALSYASMVAVAGLLLWALYGFELRALPQLAGGALPQLAGGALPIPAASHVERWLRLQENLTNGREAFLLGQNGAHGWWYYFPVAFALKTPLPALLLLLALLAQRISESASQRVSGSASQRITGYGLRITNFTFHVSRFKSKILHPAFLFPCLYAVAALFSTFNIGYRHLLPALPFLYVGLGQICKRHPRMGREGKLRLYTNGQIGGAAGQESRIKNFTFHASRFTFHVSRFTHHASRIILPLLLFWQIIGTFLVAPHYLTFFNDLVGRRSGWRYLADSNTDWGQGYKALAQYQKAHNLGSVQLAGFVFYDPAAYGVTYTALTPLPVATTPAVFPSRLAPPPGDYVIGATVLDGIPLADPEMYDWFRWREPDAVIAGALHYYHVSAAETQVNWIAQCVTPTTPLNEPAIVAGLGTATDLRRIAFDCAQSWIFPGGLAGGQSPAGVYVLHGAWVADSLAARLHIAPPAIKDPFITRRLGTSALTYRQRAYRDVPAFVLYQAAVAITLPSTPAWPAPAETAPAQLASLTPAPSPQQLEGPLAFLGLIVERNAADLDIVTWWKVTDYPTNRPISIFAHLLTADGAALGGADGLGTPTEYWQPGDILVQRHTFQLSPEQNESAVILRTGVYGLDDGRRWAVVSGPAGADALFVPLYTRPPNATSLNIEITN